MPNWETFAILGVLKEGRKNDGSYLVTMYLQVNM